MCCYPCVVIFEIGTPGQEKTKENLSIGCNDASQESSTRPRDFVKPPGPIRTLSDNNFIHYEPLYW